MCLLVLNVSFRVTCGDVMFCELTGTNILFNFDLAELTWKHEKMSVRTNIFDN